MIVSKSSSGLMGDTQEGSPKILLNKSSLNKTLSPLNSKILLHRVNKKNYVVIILHFKTSVSVSSFESLHWQLHTHVNDYGPVSKTRRGSPVECRPSTAEAPQIGKINPFIKIAVTLKPAMQFGCPL